MFKLGRQLAHFGDACFATIAACKESEKSEEVIWIVDERLSVEAVCIVHHRFRDFCCFEGDVIAANEEAHCCLVPNDHAPNDGRATSDGLQKKDRVVSYGSNQPATRTAVPSAMALGEGKGLVPAITAAPTCSSRKYSTFS